MIDSQKEKILQIKKKETKVKRTKIIATLGPASDAPENLKELILSGTNVFRLNFSHGSHEEHLARFENIKKVRKELGLPIAILADLQGPKIRVGEVSRELKEKEVVVFACDEADLGEIPVQYKGLAGDVKKGDHLLLDDGKLEVRVLEVAGQKISTQVITGGHLSSKKGINLPTGTITADVITEKDRADAEFALNNGADFLALSFVKDADDIRELKKIISKSTSPSTHVIAKIERHEAMVDLENIIKEADGIMVARGDLGIELPPQEVPMIQKKIIRRCLAHGKPAIVATQMLESMITNPRSTRAETSDIANAILDGADATMLSGETSVGAYPFNAVRAMNQIALNTERWMVEENIIIGKKVERNLSLTPEAVAKAGMVLAKETNSKYIIAATASGSNARQVSKYRPHALIIGVSHEEKVARQLSLTWGVIPFALDYKNNTEMIEKVCKTLEEKKQVKKGDNITVISGLSHGTTGGTNIVRIHQV
jgi:pyruvate kinase